MKLAVIYDSKTNNTAAVAGYMAEAMNSLEGVEAKTFLYSEVDTEFVKECKGVVFGCPTYAAGPTSDFYTWMEKNAGGLNLGRSSTLMVLALLMQLVLHLIFIPGWRKMQAV